MTSSRTKSSIGVAVVAALALAGCGSSSSSSSTSTPTTGAQSSPSTAAPATASGGTQVTADPTGKLKFNLTTLHAKAGTVTLTMTDPAGSGQAHGIAVQGQGVDKDSKIVQAGGTATVTAKLTPGTYSFYCPVKGHEAAGMKGTLIVS